MATLTLTELCAIIGEALGDSLAPYYWVKAEISSLSIKDGNLYMELVDGKTAKMRAICWSGTQQLLMEYFESETGQRLQPGFAVLVETRIQYHPVYGLSLAICNIDPSYTLGEIAHQRQRTIAQLEKDGLLDAQQLLPLPPLIRNIAVISSESAAGYEDFKHQLEHSPFAFHLSPFFATMQGETAAKSIITALVDICQQPFDAVVIIRGGGATTDLSCFDDYNLCAVSAQFEIPIITGIGHTRDISVLDLVARQALKTPTAVAEWLIHRMDDQMSRINDLIVRLQRTRERQILIRQHKIEMLEQRLKTCDPERIYKMGYSLLTKNGKVVWSVHELETGDIVVTHLADGSRELKV